MIVLELDWAGDLEPEVGVVSEPGDDVIVVVEFDAKPGPSGWPIVRVFASTSPYAMPHAPYAALNAWLYDAYGETNDAMREELLDGARVA